MTQKRVIIYLHSIQSQDASWIILDDSNHILQSIHHGQLNNLNVSQDVEIFVVIPSQKILLTQIEMPKLSRQRMLQALPYALEEQLIDDVTQLHFALGSHSTTGKIPVAVVAKQMMQEWLQGFEQLGLSPSAFIPEIFMLPYQPETWQINSNDDGCIIRTGHDSGFACESENLETMLQLKSTEMDIPVEKRYSSLQTLSLLENLPTENSYINLLQGEYQPKPQSSKIKKTWLYASYLVGAFIAFAFLSDFISFFILHHEVSKIETSINDIYKQNFPNANSIVAPRERMNEKLRTLTGQASKNSFLALLSEVGKSLVKVPSVHLQHLDFHEQQLTLEVSAATFDNLDELSHLLTQEGLSVKQQNAAAAGSQVKATLLIRAGTA